MAFKTKFRGVFLIGLLAAVTLVAWRRHGTQDANDRSLTPTEIARAAGFYVATDESGQIRQGPSGLHRLQFGSDREALEAADERGELIGTIGQRTPEEILYIVAELRAEPFAPAFLDKLEEILTQLKPDDQVRAAMFLHRHGRAAGTEFLREELQRLGTSAKTFPIANTLAMARDEESVPLLVEGFARFAGDPEFARAIGSWKHPQLLERARVLLSEGQGPPGLMAMMLAMADDQSGAAVLEKIARSTDPVFPSYYSNQAALARLGLAEPEPLLERMREMAADPSRVLASLADITLLLGPERFAPFLEELVDSYTARRLVHGEQYEEHARQMAAGTTSPGRLPGYPKMEESRMLESVSVLAEWEIPSAAEPVYRALAASQTGRYVVLRNRQLMAALIRIDPAGSTERLRSLGFTDKEIEASAEVARLQPIPQLFLPRQQSIALSKPSRPE